MKTPTIPHGYRLAEPGEKIRIGFGYCPEHSETFSFVSERSILVIGDSFVPKYGSTYICPISPPALHLPFTEADPLPEGKEGDVLIVLKPYDMPQLYYFDEDEERFTNSDMRNKGFGEAGYKFSKFERLHYGIFNITT